MYIYTLQIISTNRKCRRNVQTQLLMWILHEINRRVEWTMVYLCFMCVIYQLTGHTIISSSISVTFSEIYI